MKFQLVGPKYLEFRLFQITVVSKYELVAGKSILPLQTWISASICCCLYRVIFPLFSPRNTVFLLKGCQVVIEYKSNRKKFIFSLFLRFSQCVSPLWNVSRLKSPTWKVEIVTVHLICQSSHSSHSIKIMNFDAIIDFWDRIFIKPELTLKSS